MNSRKIQQMLNLAQSDADREKLRKYLRLIEKRSLYEESLEAFVRRAFRVLEPTTEFQDNWHIQEICSVLEAEVKRWPVMRLKDSNKPRKPVQIQNKTQDILINVPPRSLKSFIVSICLPAWAWTRRPYLKFLNSSYSHDLSMDHARRCRQLILSNWYQFNWGEIAGIDRGYRVPVVLDRSQRQKTNFSNTAGGQRYSTSVSGSATGFGADIIVGDDLQNQKESQSEPARKVAWDHWSKTLSTRLNNQKYGVRILIQQRLHESDVTGRLLGEDLPQETPEEIEKKQEHLENFHKKWKFICLPAEISDVEACERVSPKALLELYDDDLLFPERLNRQILRDLEATLGSLEYAGQYGQTPAPYAGGRIKREWIKRYGDLPSGLHIYFSIDLPFDDDKDSKNPDKVDYAAISVLGVRGMDVYLLDVINKKWDITKTRDNVLSLWKQWKPVGILIEKAANGPALIKLLREKGVPGIIGIKKPSVSKAVRLNAVAPRIEAGELWFPASAIWLSTAMKQLVKFPNVAHDDVMDTIVQFLTWWDKQRTSW